MTRIFISYRRADTEHVVGRIYDRLSLEYGQDNIFKDVDSTPPGVRFDDYGASAISRCDYVLAVIGGRWLTARGSNKQRRPSDPVRLEIEASLRAEVPLIPVLIDGVTMPTPEELPETIREIARRNATKIRADPDFGRDVERLVAGLNSASLRQPAPFGAASLTGAPTASPGSSTRPYRFLRLVVAILLMVALLTVTSLGIRQWLADRKEQTARSNQLAVELLTEDPHDVARRQLRATLEANPDSAETWSNLGALEERAGRLTESEEAYRRAAELAPESSFHLRNYASVLIDRGRYDEAAKLLEKSLELDPNNVEALNDLGWIYLQLERPKLAWRQLQRGLLIEHADTATRAALHKNAGWASLQLEHPAAAITSLETALKAPELAPKLRLEAQLLLAYALAQSERRPEACNELQNFAANSGLRFRWWRDPQELAQQLDCSLDQPTSKSSDS